MFATRVTPPNKEYSKENSRVIPKYAYKVDQKTGRKTVAKVGETNFYLAMQEAKADTLIYNVIDRYNRGDLSAIGENVGGYIDVVGLPNTLQGIEQARINAELAWSSLPLDVRNKYGHDVGAFLVDVQKQADAAKTAASNKKREELVEQEKQTEVIEE